MDIVISIKETTPGVMTTTIRGTGVATHFESKLAKHLAACISRGLDEFDKLPVQSGEGTPMRIIERELPKG
jgi:hypothetical protein